MIEIKDLTYTYTEEENPKEAPLSGPTVKLAIAGLNLTIEKGSCVAIVGCNGSGKSTLAKNLNALLLPSTGVVLVDGMDTADQEKLWEIRSRVGMVFQNPDNQLVSSIVEDDVAFGPENLGIEPSKIRDRVDDALRSVNMYEHRKKAPHLLSGGQKQRVAIAGVLAMHPDCIVFDESTAMLDPSGRDEIMQTIVRLNKHGKTVVFITHFMEEAAQADRIVVMHKGRAVLDGTPKEIFAQADKLSEYNLELPFAASVAKELREKGMNIPKDIITTKELSDYLCALK